MWILAGSYRSSPRMWRRRTIDQAAWSHWNRRLASNTFRWWWGRRLKTYFMQSRMKNQRLIIRVGSVKIISKGEKEKHIFIASTVKRWTKRLVVLVFVLPGYGCQWCSAISLLWYGLIFGIHHLNQSRYTDDEVDLCGPECAGYCAMALVLTTTLWWWHRVKVVDNATSAISKVMVRRKKETIMLFILQYNRMLSQWCNYTWVHVSSFVIN